MSRLKLLSASLLLAGLTGCASVPSDWGRADVEQLTAERGRSLPQIADAKTFTDQALLKPLSADTAVQLALINNPDVRFETARLGFAAAEVYDAGRLANPVFSLTRLSGDESAGGNVPQLTLGLAFNFANLLFLPANNRFAKAQFEAAKQSVASTALDMAARVESAWYDAIGAHQLAQMRDAAARAQRASADLAQRYFDAGNISERERAMEQAAASQAMLASISAQAEAVEARTALNRLMGLSAGQNTWTLDARLAEPLAQEDDPAGLQKLAMDSRLDLASLRRTAQAIADRYGVTRRTRLINGIQVGVERERDYDRSLNVGPTLSLELPLFNWGGGRVAAIQAALDQAEAELDGRVLDVSNEVQLAAAKVSATRTLAREYRSALIPHQEAVVAQAQKEQNYMLIGIFEVILAKQQEYDAYAGYIEAVRDYWSARVELSRAVGRELPSARQPAASTLDPAEILRPKGGGMDHSKHSMGGMSHDMKGMSMDDKSDMGGMDHSPHKAPSKPAAEERGKDRMDMKSMPGMSGMDHSQHGAPATPSAAPKDDMGGMDMKGMSHGSGAEALPPADCAAIKNQDLSKIDPVVAKALQARCSGAAAAPNPRTDRDMEGMPMKGMDRATPAPSSPEPSHEH